MNIVIPMVVVLAVMVVVGVIVVFIVVGVVIQTQPKEAIIYLGCSIALSCHPKILKRE